MRDLWVVLKLLQALVACSLLLEVSADDRPECQLVAGSANPDEELLTSSCNSLASCVGVGVESAIVRIISNVSEYAAALELGINSVELAKPDGTCVSGPLESGADKTNCKVPGLVVRSSRSTLPQLAANNSQDSACAISRRHQFIFVHTLKNAGSYTKTWLKRALCGDTDCDPCILSFEQCSAALEQNPQYFRWSWLRHPYDRAMSIYAAAKASARDDLMIGMTFEDFWLAGVKKVWSMTLLSPHHALPQANFISDQQQCLAVDFIGSLDRSQTDMGRLVHLLDVDDLKHYYASNGFRKPKQGNVFGSVAAKKIGRSARDIVQDNEVLKYILDELYAADLALFHDCDSA